MQSLDPSNQPRPGRMFAVPLLEERYAIGYVVHVDRASGTVFCNIYDTVTRTLLDIARLMDSKILIHEMQASLEFVHHMNLLPKDQRWPLLPLFVKTIPVFQGRYVRIGDKIHDLCMKEPTTSVSEANETTRYIRLKRRPPPSNAQYIEAALMKVSPDSKLFAKCLLQNPEAKMNFRKGLYDATDVIVDAIVGPRWPEPEPAFSE